MNILRTDYTYYIYELSKAKKRLKRDREIIKICQNIINKKEISPSQETRLTSLIIDSRAT